MIAALVEAKARMALLGADLAQAPKEWGEVAQVLSATMMSGTGVRAVTYSLILLLVGGSAEWLYWTYAYGPLRAVQSHIAGSRVHALRLGLRRLGLLCAGVLLFTAATIGASALLDWPEGVQEMALAVALLLLALRLSWALADTVLSPGRTARRLVPVAARHAPWLAATLVVSVLLLCAMRIVPELLQEVVAAPHSAGALRLLLATLTALLLVVAAFVFFGRPRMGAGQSRGVPQFPRSFLVAAMVVLVYGLWLLSSTPAVAPVAGIVALVVVLQLVLRGMVFFFWAERKPGAPAEDAGADAGDGTLVPNIVLSGARFVVAAVGLGACAVVLDTPLAELATRQGPMLRFVFSLLGVAALALLTHLAWITVRTTVDQRLQKIGPLDPHGEPNPEARLLTLLPLLRLSAAVVLLVMLLLSSLWALGIEVTPLLAGAGVIGLALGFGAQALVRDVIAGIFFLAEDAFRVGEYIESGSTTKGTVERITLRTVALRHHNGPLHFVPYGSLGTVRNNSRDWVIEKFNLPLPIDVDSEVVRRLIKKVGEAMLQDEEVGHLLREPLKGKLSRIDPGVKLFRCKFETTPGKQFDVRAQAIKRLEVALKAAGITFADGRQVVYVQRADDPVQVVGAASG